METENVPVGVVVDVPVEFATGGAYVPVIVDKSGDALPLNGTPADVEPVRIELLISVALKNALSAVPAVCTAKPAIPPPDCTSITKRPLLFVDV